MLRSRKKTVKQADNFLRGGAVRPLDYLRRGYQSELNQFVAKMIADIKNSITNMYDHHEDNITFDGNPVIDLKRLLDYKYRKWMKRFKLHAKNIAEKQIKDIDGSVSGSLQLSARRVAPEFTIRGDSRELLMRKKVIIDENIDLITSLPEQFYKNIKGDMQRSLAFGNDTDLLSQMLIKRGIECRKRVALIAKDQVSKATAVISTQRALDNGIKYGIWRHSHGGKNPRKSHVDAEGTVFELAKGCWIDGEYILPGQLINCDCFYEVIIGEPKLPMKLSR